MIKQQIVMDIDGIAKEGRLDPRKVQASVDSFMTEKVGFVKASDGFYLGKGRKEDFAWAGYAMTTLRRKEWFMRHVKIWLHFNSDDSDDPNDFAVEDFKAFNLTKYGVGQ